MLAWLLVLALATGFEVELQRIPGQSKWEQTGNSARTATSHQLRNLWNVRDMQMQYSGRFFIGTPPQAFTLIFDTGSSWTWVPDVSCGPNCHTSFSFSPSDSSTCEEIGERVSLAYGLGYAEGRIVNETVSFSATEGAVTRQPIVLVDYDSDFNNLQADGILVTCMQGLSFPQLSDGYVTVLENLKAQGMIERALFAFYLNDAYAGNAEGWLPSTISFGSYDLEKYAETDLTYFDAITTFDHWMVNMTAVSVGNSSFEYSVPVIIDSGTSLIYLPKFYYLMVLHEYCSVYECMPEYDLIVFPCNVSDIPYMPSITIFLEGEEYQLPPQSFIGFEDEICVILILPTSMRIGILGDVFMREYYTVFDMDNARIGLAKAVKFDAGMTTLMAKGQETAVGWMPAVCVLVGVGALVFVTQRRKRVTGDLHEPLLQADRSAN